LVFRPELKIPWYNGAAERATEAFSWQPFGLELFDKLTALSHAEGLRASSSLSLRAEGLSNAEGLSARSVSGRVVVICRFAESRELTADRSRGGSGSLNADLKKRTQFVVTYSATQPCAKLPQDTVSSRLM
jgi:hypothetical protein